jgi:hypothetical protein
MARHKNRAGQLLTSGACKRGDHGKECDEFLAMFEEDLEPMTCHCECHPDDGCVPTIKRRPHKSRICGSCHLDHPEGTEC